jgi:hypothetical protein
MFCWGDEREDGHGEAEKEAAQKPHGAANVGLEDEQPLSSTSGIQESESDGEGANPLQVVWLSPDPDGLKIS